MMRELLLPLEEETQDFWVMGNRKFFKIDGKYIPSYGSTLYERAARWVKIFGSVEDGTPEADKLTLKVLNQLYFELLYAKAGTTFIDFVNEEKTYIGGHSLLYTAASNIHYGPTHHVDLYIIGERPSFAEEQQRLNFVGDFGELLRESLREAGLSDFRNIYVANACRVNLNYRPHVTRAIKEFLPLFYNEILLLRPKITICIGAQALHLFTRKSIKDMLYTSLNYDYTTWDFVLGKEVTDTMKVLAAPLTALHEYGDFLSFKNSIQRCITYHYFNQTPDRDLVSYEIVSTTARLREIVDDILKNKTTHRIAIDAEWEGDLPTDPNAYVRTVSFAVSDKHVYIVEICDVGGNQIIDSLDEFAESMNRLVAPGNGIQVAGHNISADIPWLKLLGVDLLPKLLHGIKNCFTEQNYDGVFDTMVAHHAHDESGTFGLEASSVLYLGVEPWSQELEAQQNQLKSTNSDIHGFGLISKTVLYPYTAKDCAYTYRLVDIHRKYLNADRFGNSCWVPYWINMGAMPGFIEMFETGILYDEHTAQELTNLYKETLEEKIREFRELIDWPTFNPRSSKQCTEFLYGEEYSGKKTRPEGSRCLYLVPLKTTNGLPWEDKHKGRVNPSTDSETCEYFSKTNPLVQKLYHIKVLDQIIKTFLQESNEDGKIGGLRKFLCHDNRIHPRYFPYLETRRCSSRDPNMQNLPNTVEENYRQILGEKYKYPIRTVFKADDGYLLVAADYSGAELLALAVSANDEQLIEDYYNSDIHSVIAVQAFKLNCEPTKEALKACNKSNLRLCAKRIIFGLNYGRGAQSCHRQLVASGVDISLEEVNTIIDTIYSRYYRVKQFQTEARGRVKDPRWICNIFGSYRRFGISRSEEIVNKMEREALNFPCQSSVADAISLALYNLYVHPLKEELRYKLLLQNHDEIVLLVPEETHERVIQTVIPDCLVNKIKFVCRDLSGRALGDKEYSFLFETKVGRTLGDLVT